MEKEDVIRQTADYARQTLEGEGSTRLAARLQGFDQCSAYW